MAKFQARRPAEMLPTMSGTFIDKYYISSPPEMRSIIQKQFLQNKNLSNRSLHSGDEEVGDFRHHMCIRLIPFYPSVKTSRQWTKKNEKCKGPLSDWLPNIAFFIARIMGQCLISSYAIPVSIL